MIIMNMYVWSYVVSGPAPRTFYSIKIVGHAMAPWDARCGQPVLVRACECKRQNSNLKKKAESNIFPNQSRNTRRNGPRGAAYASRCRQCSICRWFPVLCDEAEVNSSLLFERIYVGAPETLRITLQPSALGWALPIDFDRVHKQTGALHLTCQSIWCLLLEVEKVEFAVEIYGDV